jgi:hypothetical protein
MPFAMAKLSSDRQVFRPACPAPSTKTFFFPSPANHQRIHSRPRPSEGRIAIVTDVGGDAVDADALLTKGAEADGEVVWS